MEENINQNQQESSKNKSNFLAKIQAKIGRKTLNWIGIGGAFILLFTIINHHNAKLNSSSQVTAQDKAMTLAYATKDTRQSAIPVAGQKVIPDENGFSDELPSVVSVKSDNNAEVLKKITDTNQKIDDLANKVTQIQVAINAMQSSLQAQPKIIPSVKVLGVIQSMKDGLWHADVLINSKTYDVVSGEKVAGIEIIKVSQNGVDWKDAE